MTTIRRLVRAVITWWHRNDPPPPLPRNQRVTRVALAFDVRWDTGDAQLHLEEFDREFVYHLLTLGDRNDLFTRAVHYLEVQTA
jgi:hypothetical protein